MTTIGPEYTYFDNGNIYCIAYRNSSGQCHNENGPACIFFFDDGTKQYEAHFLNGNFHNERGPAVINYYYNGNKAIELFYINGILHNKNGPAWIEYHLNGKKEFEEYHFYGKLHNLKGPSIIKFHQNGKIKYNLRRYAIEDRYIKGVNSNKQFFKYLKLNNIS